MKTALVTGFEPFGGETVNASIEAVRRLPPRLDSLEIATAELPVSHARAARALEAAIARTRPGLVLCVGQAGDRAALCVERVAVNLQDARIADNDCARPADEPIVAGGPAAYLATWPVRASVAALQAAGLPAQVSMSAGTFVCNHVFYDLMRMAASHRPPFRAGFLHVPCLAGQAAPGAPSMTLEDLVRALVIVLESAASRR